MSILIMDERDKAKIEGDIVKLTEEIDALYKKLLTEDVVNALIDSKLGVIENGTY